MNNKNERGGRADSLSPGSAHMNHSVAFRCFFGLVSS